MRYLVPLVIGLLLAACVTTEVTRLDSAPSGLSPMDTSEVAVYSDTVAVECDYVRVALINAQGSTSDVSDSKMIKNAKVDAAKMRANALIIGGHEDR